MHPLAAPARRARPFRTNNSDAMDIVMISEWAKGFNEQAYASLSADHVWGRDSSESFARAVKAQGGEVKPALHAPLGTQDFWPHIAQLKQAIVEAIRVAEVGRDSIAFVKQAQEFGLIPKIRLIGHAPVHNFVIDATDKALGGTLGTIGYAADLDTPRNKAFVAAWKTRFNRLPIDNDGMAYRDARVMFDGGEEGRQRQARRCRQGAVGRHPRHHLRPGADAYRPQPARTAEPRRAREIGRQSTASAGRADVSGSLDATGIGTAQDVTDRRSPRRPDRDPRNARA